MAFQEFSVPEMMVQAIGSRLLSKLQLDLSHHIFIRQSLTVFCCEGQ